jgi:hypothetical protein
MPELSQQKQRWLADLTVVQRQHRRAQFLAEALFVICALGLAGTIIRFLIEPAGVLLGLPPFLLTALTYCMYVFPKYTRCSIDLERIRIAIEQDEATLLTALKADFVCFKDLQKVLYHGNKSKAA